VLLLLAQAAVELLDNLEHQDSLVLLSLVLQEILEQRDNLDLQDNPDWQE